MKLQREVADTIGPDPIAQAFENQGRRLDTLSTALAWCVATMGVGAFCVGLSMYCGGRDRAALEDKLHEMTVNRDAWKKVVEDDDKQLIECQRARNAGRNSVNSVMWDNDGTAIFNTTSTFTISK